MDFVEGGAVSPGYFLEHSHLFHVLGGLGDENFGRGRECVPVVIDHILTLFFED